MLLLSRPSWWRLVNSVNTSFVGYDRVRFRDLAAIPATERWPASDIINFYLAVHNSANYLPVLGIRKMLNRGTDTWNMHDRSIGFHFVNRHYRCVIIGGAGLLDKGFEPFWCPFSRECRLPAVIGALASARRMAAPIMASIARFSAQRRRSARSSTSATTAHGKLVAESEHDVIRRQLKQCVGVVRVTDNIQRRLLSLDDIVRGADGMSRLVVSTRLHGAIIAYKLRIP